MNRKKRGAQLIDCELPVRTMTDLLASGESNTHRTCDLEFHQSFGA